MLIHWFLSIYEVREVNNRSHRRECLDSKKIEGLATAIAEGLGSDPKTVGSLEEISGNMLFFEGIDYSKHLYACVYCRRRLIDEVNFLVRYEKALKSKDTSKDFEDAIRRMKEEKHDHAAATEIPQKKVDVIKIELKYSPYPKKEAKQALAAATSNQRREPLRFASEDGSIILKEIFNDKTNNVSYDIIGIKEDIAFELIVNKESYHFNSISEFYSYNNLSLSFKDKIHIIILT